MAIAAIYPGETGEARTTRRPNGRLPEALREARELLGIDRTDIDHKLGKAKGWCADLELDRIQAWSIPAVMALDELIRRIADRHGIGDHYPPGWLLRRGGIIPTDGDVIAEALYGDPDILADTAALLVGAIADARDRGRRRRRGR